MKKLNVLILLVVMVAAFTLSGCEVSVTTANFDNLQMASEVDLDSYTAVTTTDVYAVDTPEFYLTGVVANAPEGTVVTAEWYYLDNDPEIFIDEASIELVETTTNVIFSLAAPDDGWPVGSYEVMLYIDGEYEESVNFTVE